MWTETTRRQYRREDLRYASDMTDPEWALIEPHLPAAKPLGRPRCVPLRAVVEALLYLLRTASPWRLLPRDFPNRSTVQRYFYAWQAAGVWETINFLLLQQARERAGREASPSAGVIDSQSVKTTGEAAAREGMMRARRSTAASATSLPTPPGTSSRPGSTPAISKIAMGRPLCSPRSATCSPGCAMSLPMAAMPAGSWRRRWPDTGSGRSRSSSGPIEPRDFSSCHDAGWL